MPRRKRTRSTSTTSSSEDIISRLGKPATHVAAVQEVGASHLLATLSLQEPLPVEYYKIQRMCGRGLDPALSQEEAIQEHYDRVLELQSTSLRLFPESKVIRDFTLKPVTNDADALRQHLAHLPEDQLQALVNALPSLPSPPPDASHELMLTILLLHLKKPESPVNHVPPTEADVLEAPTLEKLVPLGPKTDFFSPRDYVERCAEHARADIAFDVHNALQDVGARKKSAALQIRTIKVVRVEAPKVGRVEPSKVIVEVLTATPIKPGTTLVALAEFQPQDTTPKALRMARVVSFTSSTTVRVAMHPLQYHRDGNSLPGNLNTLIPLPKHTSVSHTTFTLLVDEILLGGFQIRHLPDWFPLPDTDNSHVVKVENLASYAVEALTSASPAAQAAERNFKRRLVVLCPSAVALDRFVNELGQLGIDKGKIVCLDGSDAALLPAGRVRYALKRREELLKQVQHIAESLSIPGDFDTCELAQCFYLEHKHQLPTAQQNAEALFAELREYRALELMREQRHRENLMLTRNSSIVLLSLTNLRDEEARKSIQQAGLGFDELLVDSAHMVRDVDVWSAALGLQTHTIGRLGKLVLGVNAPTQALGVPWHASLSLGGGLGALQRASFWSREEETGKREEGGPDPQADLPKDWGIIGKCVQWIRVGDYQGRGEINNSAGRRAGFSKHLGEAEFVVGLYMYLRRKGYGDSVAILAASAAQTDLIRDIIKAKCAPFPQIFGSPKVVETLDEALGVKMFKPVDIVILACVVDNTKGWLESWAEAVRARVARKALFVFGRLDKGQDGIVLPKGKVQDPDMMSEVVADMLDE